MKLLKIRYDHLTMFKDGVFDIDLYASDRVPSTDESVFALSGPIYSCNVVALAGVNASGKTTALKLIELACAIVNGGVVPDAGFLAGLPLLFDGPSSFSCLAWHGRCAYLIEATVASDDPFDTGTARLAIFNEAVYRVSSASLSKKALLSSWEELERIAVPIFEHEEDDALGWGSGAPLVSLINHSIAHDAGSPALAFATRDEGYRLGAAFDGLDDVLRVFDGSIEHLEVRDRGRAYQLTFSGQAPMTLSEDGLEEVLSSGTLRGLALVQRAVKVLARGGYLLVDELENHLNRQLVNVLLDLFTSAETNPHGASIVFSTHYSQLLDHVHRKDNVFFLVRSGSDGAQVVKYGDRVKRIENKKSEVFASNYVKGTAPRYANVRALRDLVAKGVDNG